MLTFNYSQSGCLATPPPQSHPHERFSLSDRLVGTNLGFFFVVLSASIIYIVFVTYNVQHFGKRLKKNNIFSYMYKCVL